MSHPTPSYHFLVIAAASRGAWFFLKKALQPGHSATALCPFNVPRWCSCAHVSAAWQSDSHHWQHSICSYTLYNPSSRQKYPCTWNLSNAPLPRQFHWSSILLCWSYQLMPNATRGYPAILADYPCLNHRNDGQKMGGILLPWLIWNGVGFQ